MRILFALLACLLGTSVFAQSATLAVFPAGTSDPNTATPIATPVVYTPVCGQMPKLVAAPLNPTQGAYDDPANPLRDCRLAIGAQIATLAPGSGYRAAVKVDGSPYSALSNAFAVQSPPHPCDTTPTSRTTAVVGQSVTIGFCHPQLGTGGDAVTVTSLRLYRNGVFQATATPGAPSVTGWVYASVTRVEAVAGVSSYDMSAVTALGEGARSATFAVTVTPPASLPVAPSRGRIQ